MNNIFRFHPLERPKADGPNMLSNDERINPNIVPLEKLRAMGYADEFTSQGCFYTSNGLSREVMSAC